MIESLKFTGAVLKDIENECKTEFNNLELVFFQSNSESEIIEYIHSSNKFSALIINAGAFTHTSIAIHDALKAVKTKKLKFIYQTFILGKNLEKNLLLVQWLMVLLPV